MDPRLVTYAEQNAPRYTSYPTAPHFEASVDAAVYKRWLGELPPDASLSLYLHTPYCREMCWYCGCHAFGARRDEPVADYVEAIMAEIGAVAAATPARRVSEIHWGGGTPNLLSPDRFEAVVARLRAHFDLGACARHAVEIDPRLLTGEQAEASLTKCLNTASAVGDRQILPMQTNNTFIFLFLFIANYYCNRISGSNRLKRNNLNNAG